MPTTLYVFDPAMCCPTGICGPAVDPLLTAFAADLAWLRSQNVHVERFNLAQEPAAFANDPEVCALLQAQGPECLPLIKVNGEVRSVAAYPSRGELATWTNLASEVAPFESAPKMQGCCPPEPSKCASEATKSKCC